MGVGIFVLTQAIPSLCGRLVDTFQQIKKYSGSPNTFSVHHSNFRYIVEYCAKIMIAVCLIFSPQKILKFIKSTRTLGVPKEENNNLD